MNSNRRRSNGEETRYRLIDWTGGQAPAERLSSHILSVEGYTSIDPSHPFGGRDGKKDMICNKNGMRWIGACYFPKRTKTFKQIKDKFLDDLNGITKNRVDGMVFITNQEITISKRRELEGLTKFNVDIFHLERIVNILNSPHSYGARQEFLDINMTEEEKVSSLYSYQEQIKELLYQLVSVNSSEKLYSVYDSYSFDPNAGSAGFLLSGNINQSMEIEQYKDYTSNKFGEFTIDKLFANYNSNIKFRDQPLDLSKGKQYDVIIMNPPYVSNREIEMPCVNVLQNTTSRQLNNLYQAIHSLKPSGQSRAAVVLTDDALKETSGKEIRKQLIEKCDLDTILRLPFLPFENSQEKMNILLFRRKTEEENRSKIIWVYNLRRALLEDNQQTEVLIEKFIKAYAIKDSRDVNWTLVPVEEIKRKGYNLDLTS